MRAEIFSQVIVKVHWRRLYFIQQDTGGYPRLCCNKICQFLFNHPTFEIAKKEQLTFIILIIRNFTNKLAFDVYRKDTNTQEYTPTNFHHRKPTQDD